MDVKLLVCDSTHTSHHGPGRKTKSQSKRDLLSRPQVTEKLDKATRTGRLGAGKEKLPGETASFPSTDTSLGLRNGPRPAENLKGKTRTLELREIYPVGKREGGRAERLCDCVCVCVCVFLDRLPSGLAPAHL